ncbi:MAG: hypothetical protein ACK4IX_15475, partial [Candidatus Sericytochromatia bacterium]
SYTSDKNWIYSFYKDTNGNSLLDNGDIPINPLGLSIGNVYSDNSSHSVKLIVKVSIPSNVPLETVDTLKITGVLTPTDTTKPTISIDVQDITTVTQRASGVGLKLIKSVSPVGAQPPNTILNYSITFSNLGDSSISGLIIKDVVPDKTSYVSSSIDSPWSATITAPSLGGSGEINWKINGIIPVGQTGTVRFSVRIK